MSIKTQFGELLTGDLEENTMTFEIEGEMELKAGRYAIVPKDKYEELILSIMGIMNSMKAHPDCTKDSEFECMVNRCKESLED